MYNISIMHIFNTCVIRDVCGPVSLTVNIHNVPAGSMRSVSTLAIEQANVRRQITTRTSVTSVIQTTLYHIIQSQAHKQRITMC